LTIARLRKRKTEKAASQGEMGVSCGRGAGQHADGVQTRQDDDIDQNDALEREGISQRGHKIEQQVDQERSWQVSGHDQASAASRKRDGKPGSHGKIACGEGTLALVQVYAVMLQVKQVVENVGSRSE
jgi:hypothetical protein